MVVVLYKNACPLEFGSVSKTKQGSSQCKIHSEYIQTCVCTVPFGVSEFITDTGDSRFSLELSLQDKSEMLSYLEKIDNQMKITAFQTEAWFGKKMSMEVIDELYRSVIKESKFLKNTHLLSK